MAYCEYSISEIFRILLCRLLKAVEMSGGYDNSAIFSALGRGTVGTVSVPAPLESEFQRRHAVWFHRK